MEENRLENTICSKQTIINELENIIESIKESYDDKIRIKIETKHWYGFSEPFRVKKKHKIKYEKDTILEILENVIRKEREYINECIDMEIELRKNEV